jgi:hypothetical protein
MRWAGRSPKRRVWKNNLIEEENPDREDFYEELVV